MVTSQPAEVEMVRNNLSLFLERVVLSRSKAQTLDTAVTLEGVVEFCSLSGFSILESAAERPGK